MTRARTISGFLVAGLAVAASAPLLSHDVNAADHLDAPKAQANIPADITDVHAWHTDAGKVVAILSFAGLTEVGLPATYDPSVLYGIHVDNDGDFAPDLTTWIRFGQNGAGDWGVQVVGLPGSEDPIVGPVETVLTGNLGLRVFAGLRDDAFFFDLQGLNETLMTGDLSFDAKRDTFAQTNVTAIAVEMSTDAVIGGGTTFNLWTTTRVPQ